MLNGKKGYFGGIRSRSGRILVGTKEGVKLARSVRRIPLEDRWSADILDTVKWVPWKTSLTDAAEMGPVEIAGMCMKPLEELRMTKAVAALKGGDEAEGASGRVRGVGE